MRNAEDFVREYRKRGYTDERIRVIANLTREPLRGEVLSILESGREIGMGDQVPAEEQVKPQRGKEAELALRQEAGPSPATPPEIKAAERDETTGAELRKASAQLAQIQREKGRLERELEEQKALIVEFKKGTERVAAITRQLDEARHDIEQAREQEVEKDAALEAAVKERSNAQRQAEEFAEKIAESESAVTALQERIAQQERQLKETRVRGEQESAKLRKDSEMEARHLRRRLTTYKKAAVGATIAAAALLVAVVITPHGFVTPAPPQHTPNIGTALAPSALPDLTSANIATSPLIRRAGDGAQNINAMTRTDAAPVPLAFTPPDGIVQGVTTTGSEPLLGADLSARWSSRGLSSVTAPVTAQNPEAMIYVVKKNDSLWKICKEQLGDVSLVNKVAGENNITTKTTLRIGMRLRLPARSAAPVTSM